MSKIKDENLLTFAKLKVLTSSKMSAGLERGVCDEQTA
jgi:hypothetical protein